MHRKVLPFACFAILIVDVAARAEIDQVTLHPQSAVIEERLAAPLVTTPSGTVAVFTVPRATDTSGIRVRAETRGVAVGGLAWREIDASETPDLAALRARLKAAVAERDVAKASVEAMEAQAGFWKNMRLDGSGTADAAARLATTLGENLNSLLGRLYAARENLTKKDQEVARIEEELARATGGADTAIEVRATVEGASGKTVALHLAYAVSGCGWTPAYRLDAEPGKSSVEIVFEAVMSQSTGREWNAPLRLATTPPMVRLEPPALPQWIIRPRDDAMPRPLGAARMTMDAAAPMVESAMAKEAVREDYGASAAWDMGVRAVPPGEEMSLPVRRISAKAEFVHLLRPMRGEEAYLKARLTLPEAASMPRGPARFLVDGAMVGEGAFGLEDTESDVFFGTDPLVSLKTEVLTKGSGERGLFGRTRTHAWGWRFTVQNGRTVPLAALIEEPLPLVRDERVELTIKATPEITEQKDGIASWRIAVPAKGSANVTWNVDLRAPADLELDLGRR